MLQVYNMSKSRKGKACILSIPYFIADGLETLDGYVADSRRLASLWSQIGFDIYQPKYDGRYHLTAEVSNIVLLWLQVKLTQNQYSNSMFVVGVYYIHNYLL